ncbi:MAG: OmpH family outer membrane protein [Deltaproteobacteria bacterium]|nr:OmpH family outer membrane protein [Deltaproteobacteria bacterium]
MKALRTAVLVMFAWFLVAALPAGAAELKIGYANLQKALNESQAGVKAKEDLKVEAEGLEGELSKKQEELKKMKDELDKKASVWNKETRDAKEKDFKARTADFQKKFMEYGENLNKKKQDTEARIIKELRDTVEEIAKKKGLTFVFEKSVGGLLYAPKELDLTDEVIKAYDAKKKKK